ncbi:iron uptake transporter deferrochelatase/peroxidase subunit [Pseudonocardia nematodicida]|uniref:Deferrochelatase n=1 Tax=Pseudonocardia nematodicida TaxID=1206997 RepID=A0ABV1KB34_9PSEU
MTGPVSRRGLLGLAGAGAALAGAGAAAGYGVAREPVAAADDGVVAFRGVRQAGIVTPAQDRMHFVALDLTATDRGAVRDLLRRWTAAAERMTAGQDTADDGALPGNVYAVPADTGEAIGLAASRLTLTFGVGPSFLQKLGLADRRPAPLADLPAFQGDRLDPARTGGDLCLQACADDPQVAVHAVRNLVRAGFGVTEVRWSQLGFGRTSSTSTGQATARNLFGFKDGTNNLKAEEPDLLDQHVWVGDEGPEWLRGGSYLVARRIRMHIEPWDRSNLDEQQRIVGRTKGVGAPLSGSNEFDLADYAATDAAGPVIPDDAHIRLASAQANAGARILRRGYNFVDGSDGDGHLDAGLFFVAFVRDPQRGFVPIQRSLAKSDAMSEYLEHNGSAVFAVPPGLSGPDDYWGAALLA